MMVGNIKTIQTKYQIVALLLFSYVYSCGQDSLMRQCIGIDVSVARPGTFMSAVYPSLTWSSGRHVVFAGPGITYYNWEYPQPMFGGQGGYQFFTNGRSKRFNLYFEYNVCYVQAEFIDKFNRPGYMSQSGNFQRTIKMVALDNYFGFGFRLNFSKRLYLKMNYGLSAGFFKESYTYIFADGTEYSADGHLYPRNFTLRNRIVKAGLGYDFFSFRKKGRK